LVFTNSTAGATLSLGFPVKRVTVPAYFCGSKVFICGTEGFILPAIFFGHKLSLHATDLT
jgi:hypothetical protein